MQCLWQTNQGNEDFGTGRLLRQWVIQTHRVPDLYLHTMQIEISSEYKYTDLGAPIEEIGTPVVAALG